MTIAPPIGPSSSDDTGVPRGSAMRRWKIRRILWIVAGVALITNAFSLAASHLWVFPDSIDYIVLAGGIADHLNFTDELFLVRTPGYPLLLAVMFWIFGTASPAAILVFQHAAAIATAVLAAATAWHLTSCRGVTMLTGLLCACSLQILAYANVALTETFFGLTLIICAYALTRYIQRGRRGDIILASVMVGLSYLLKPIALTLAGACLLAVVIRAWNDTRSALVATGWPHDTRSAATPLRRWAVATFLRRGAMGKICATAPALALAAPWMIISSLTHDSLQATRCLDYVLYLRAATFDGLDSDKSEALADIKQTIVRAKAIGAVPDDADYRDRATVMDAYRVVHGAPIAESTAIMGRAARDLMRENVGSLITGTFKYSAWMLLAPDSVYRFQPGGAPGVGGRRNKDAVIFDSGTYAFGPGSWEPELSKYAHHLPLRSDERAATPLWSAIAQTYYQLVEKTRPPLGLGDTMYEPWTALFVIGALISLILPKRYGRSGSRGAWLVIAAVVCLHVLVSAFLSGPQTRYALPIKGLLMLYTSVALWVPLRSVLSLIRRYARADEAVAVHRHERLAVGLTGR